MTIEFDSEKDRANRQKLGISLSLAAEMDLETAILRKDERRDYQEPRWLAAGMLISDYTCLFLPYAARHYGLFRYGRPTYAKGDIMSKDPENPEWTAEDFARA